MMATTEPSPWLLLIRAADAHKARRDFGLVHGERAAWHRWLAQRRAAGPERFGLVSLMAFEEAMLAAFEVLGG